MDIIYQLLQLYRDGKYPECIEAGNLLAQQGVFQAEAFKCVAECFLKLGHPIRAVRWFNIYQSNTGGSREDLVHFVIGLILRSPDVGAAVEALRELNSPAESILQTLDQITYSQLSQGHTEVGLRARDVRVGVQPFKNKKLPELSVIIPVLDLSPNTPGYNFLTLLSDLTDADAEVIVVFNCPELGVKYREHPRINFSLVSSCNLGVARAWNLGIQIARTKYCIIANADLRLNPTEVFRLVEPFERDPAVAMTGPVGYVRKNQENIPKSRDTIRLAEEVEAIGGFLFCIKTRDFHDGSFCFDPELTPAFSEEDDIANQIRSRGRKLVAVPIGGYEHGLSGSHRGRVEISYYDQCIGKSELLARNLAYVTRKWAPDR